MKRFTFFTYLLAGAASLIAFLFHLNWTALAFLAIGAVGFLWNMDIHSQERIRFWTRRKEIRKHIKPIPLENLRSCYPDLPERELRDLQEYDEYLQEIILTGSGEVIPNSSEKHAAVCASRLVSESRHYAYLVIGTAMESVLHNQLVTDAIAACLGRGVPVTLIFMEDAITLPWKLHALAKNPDLFLAHLSGYCSHTRDIAQRIIGALLQRHRWEAHPR